VIVRVLYRQEPEGWWAESPDILSWTVAGEGYEAVRELALDGAPFALACEAEDRDEHFDKARFVDVELAHFVLTR